MERPNQPPKTECCRGEGQAKDSNEGPQPNDILEAYTGQIAGRKQDTHPAQAIQPRDGTNTQVGTVFPNLEPKTSQPAKGEGGRDLPGSKSVAREETVVRNLGGPIHSRRTNHEGQAGKRVQRQEAPSEGGEGFRL